MNKAELIRKVAEATNQNKGTTKEILENLLETLTDSLVAGNNIEIRGFGSFKLKKRKEQRARNPRTGEEVIVPSRFVPTFKPSKRLAELVAKKKS